MSDGAQGQTLENVLVLSDAGELGQGVAYVALSCVKSLQRVKSLSPLQMPDFSSGDSIICCGVSLNVNYDGQGST